MTFVLSFLTSRTDQNGVFFAQRRRFTKSFSRQRVCMSEIARLRSPKKTLAAHRGSGQSEASSAGQVHRTVQSVAFTKKRQGALLVQLDSSGRTTSRTPSHTEKLLRLSKSKGFGASFGRTTKQNRWLSQSHPLVGLSSDGISSDG